MDFGRRKNWNRREEGRDRPKLAILGAIFFVTGILIGWYFGVNKNMLEVFIGSGVLSLIGFVMLLFSPSRRNQTKLADGIVKILRELTKPPKQRCNCCKCTNCGLRHNHWTHD